MNRPMDEIRKVLFGKTRPISESAGTERNRTGKIILESLQLNRIPCATSAREILCRSNVVHGIPHLITVTKFPLSYSVKKFTVKILPLSSFDFYLVRVLPYLNTNTIVGFNIIVCCYADR